MGKPYKAALAEAVKCAGGCRYYAQNAERFLGDEVLDTGTQKSFIRYRPIGPILAVMPWNFPFWQVIRFAAPALIAGNVGLLSMLRTFRSVPWRLKRFSWKRDFLRAHFKLCSSALNRSMRFSTTRALSPPH